MTTSSSRVGTWPTLSYADAEAALEYLKAVVGFTESVVHRGNSERPISHAELLWPVGGGIMFGSDAGDQGWTGARRVGTGSLYLVSDDVEGIAGRVQAAGWRMIRPVQTTDYGSTECAFLDPEGNAFSVGSYAGHSAD